MSIQALRFLAAFAVVVLHNSFYTQERLDPHTQVYTLGANGVRLFFVISGFVMILSSQKLIGAPRGWSVFAFKRVLRIVPLYWGITIFKIATMFVTTGLVLHAKIDWIYILKSSLFIPAENTDNVIRPLVGVGWTLNFEMFFYALFTVALFLRVRPLIFLSPILIMMACLSLFKTKEWGVPLFFLCDPIVIDFLAGMIIAQLCLRSRFLPFSVAWIAAVVGLLYLFGPALRPAYGTMTASLLTTLAAAATVLSAISLEPILRARIPLIVSFMGAASYSLYLIHPVIAPAVPQLFARAHLGLAPVAIIGGVALACILAAVCYKFVETPISALLDRRAKQLGLLDPRITPHTDLVPLVTGVEVEP